MEDVLGFRRIIAVLLAGVLLMGSGVPGRALEVAEPPQTIPEETVWNTESTEQTEAVTEATEETGPAATTQPPQTEPGKTEPTETEASAVRAPVPTISAATPGRPPTGTGCCSSVPPMPPPGTPW